jgi:hypothetical protein
MFERMCWKESWRGAGYIVGGGVDAGEQAVQCADLGGVELANQRRAASDVSEPHLLVRREPPVFVRTGGS